MSDLRQDHGRLVARLRRQIAKVERLGSTTYRRRVLLATVRELVLVERRMVDPVEAVRRRDDVTVQEMRDRLTLMAPGAGIEVA